MYKAVTDFLVENHAAVTGIKAAAGIIVLFVAYKIVRYYIKRIAANRVSRAAFLLLEKIPRYLFLLLAVIYVFNLFGIDINAVLGAAGIAGVAIGFAAQTSVSNIISGFFLLSEKTIKIGDFVSIDSAMGTVDSINLLSIKLKTPDNQMLRVPNETIIKSNLINYSMFNERRFSLRVSVSYDADLAFALETLKKVPEQCGGLILPSPAPAVFADSFDDSGITLVLNAWFLRENLFAAKSALFVTAKKMFKDSGVALSFPRMDVRVMGN
jgi:small-conductance mechanosensitive channel